MADSVKTENMAPPPELRDAGPPPSEDLPPPDVLQKVAGLEVLDAEGKAHPFASLYSGPDVTARVLVIFVRNVFCGVSELTEKGDVVLMRFHQCEGGWCHV